MWSKERRLVLFGSLLILSLVINQFVVFAASGKTGTRKPAYQTKFDQPAASVAVSRQRIFAPHWTTEAGFQTTIYIRNVHIQQPVTTQLSLVLEHHTIVLPATTIDPLQTIAVDIAKIIRSQR